jgi:hypothetical protein
VRRSVQPSRALFLELEMTMTKSELSKLTSKIKQVSRGLTALGDERELVELLRIIRRPGWTTPAEFLLVQGGLDSMLALTKGLAGLKQALLKGSRAVRQ